MNEKEKGRANDGDGKGYMLRIHGKTTSNEIKRGKEIRRKAAAKDFAL
jgi:hypothetical protein